MADSYAQKESSQRILGQPVHKLEFEWFVFKKSERKRRKREWERL